MRDLPVPDEFTMVEQFARTERMVVRFFMDGDDPVLVWARCGISASFQHISDQFSQVRDILG